MLNLIYLISVFLIFFPIFLKYRAMLFIDSLVFFNKHIHQLIGKDMNRLFGLNNVILKNSEIYVNNTRGLDCAPNSDMAKWPLGKIVIQNLKNVKKNLIILTLVSLIVFFISSSRCLCMKD